MLYGSGAATGHGAACRGCGWRWRIGLVPQRWHQAAQQVTARWRAGAGCGCGCGSGGGWQGLVPLGRIHPPQHRHRRVGLAQSAAQRLPACGQGAGGLAAAPAAIPRQQADGAGPVLPGLLQQPDRADAVQAAGEAGGGQWRCVGCRRWCRICGRGGLPAAVAGQQQAGVRGLAPQHSGRGQGEGLVPARGHAQAAVIAAGGVEIQTIVIGAPCPARAGADTVRTPGVGDAAVYTERCIDAQQINRAWRCHSCWLDCFALPG